MTLLDWSHTRRRRRYSPGRLWARWILLADGEADKVYRAHRALGRLRAEAGNHLVLPSRRREIAIRSEYDAAVFHSERIRNTHVQALTLHAVHQCAHALSPVAGLDAETRMHIRAEMDLAYEAARSAMFEYLDEIGAYL